MILPIIMAGGSGTRLWPLSRQLFPKQFLSINGKRSMLQDTFFRINELDHLAPIIICNEEHRFVVAEQLRTEEINGCNIILEPVGRNTAPAIALAAFQAIKTNQDPLLLVLAADHVIKDKMAFNKAVESASILALKNYMVTFGIKPTSPETGYGYIKAGQSEGSGYFVEKFVEKPNSDTAKKYIASGNHYWNSGMFMFKASKFLNELEQYAPEIYNTCKQATDVLKVDADFIRINQQIFETCPSDSIDYAVMEKTSKAMVVPLDAQWSDIGSWSALWDIEAKDAHGNVCHGDVVNIDTNNSYIKAVDKLVTTIGLNDVVVVETKDAILVSKKSEVQKVKSIVEKLRQDGRSETTDHREVYRPWGKYDAIDSGNRFKVKRITVKPGAKLSVQMHHHRAEHWIVVSGTARVTNGEQQVLLTENQSTYIPIGSIHALENPGLVNLELIEVQSGTYLGEDDIVRYEDKYGRS
ncbi:mannose-1-phosphate guanylyltransferase/mannose-6-phosphate isomerase [Parashewanella spongiae]|uniref:mannose-1-phosphate guanylyltransferase n=1 Tax=Parashewanella spongiae TaxID=342950 RepID=A0A3A6U210_9GAMM|nr:mannose-1-phosphate guanylyltransferase/mannose-6-phosphate isomerase [Parashewanella spongiae]MCL1077748.1 mannose-1-phosphate guanylyltransferase/mannose-6-phosphate isomerase [Parashewanella spongiae]RJY18051.1 mannose-1-phosphate guanylyltransferase/mannose-6-phosphate isomerase [Parashewanella spongiae]